MKQALYALCFLLAASQAAQALSYRTAEGNFAGQVALSAHMFAREHEGRSPSSWSDLQPYVGSPIDEAYRFVTPNKRYAFLPQPLRLPPPHEGDLVIVTRRPFRDGRLYTNWYGGISHGLREPGRYIIYRTSTGEFRVSYVDEAYIQQAFRGFESLLPAPDTEPLRPHEASAPWRSIVPWTIVALIASALLVRKLLPRSSTSSDYGRNV